MKFSASVAAASLVALSQAASLPFNSATGPDPSQVYITSFTYAGTGCPVGTVANAIAADRTSVTFIFDQYVASVGINIPITESRKNCQLNIGLHYPSGWQYSIFQASYRGYAGLAKGQTGTQKSTYYFTNGDNHQQFNAQSDINGPYATDYLFTDKIDTTSTVWSPCGIEGLLNINSQVRITGDLSKPGQMTTDSIDGSFKQILAVQWQKCKP
ncbi:hypothetical protein ABW21_db0205176 [Orbilia brochopaga]|nr:hypothetical protein ABW21_db0205176 [Drechslerella brochopaga]